MTNGVPVFTNSIIWPGRQTAPPRQFRIGLLWSNTTAYDNARHTFDGTTYLDSNVARESVWLAIRKLNIPGSASNMLFSALGMLI
jgi:hypothetical protein